MTFARVGQLFSQFPIATDAAAGRDEIDIVLFCSDDCFANENVDNRLLHRGANVGQIISFQLWQKIAHRGFQTAEAEIFRIGHAPRPIETLRITVDRTFFDFRPARITEA